MYLIQIISISYLFTPNVFGNIYINLASTEDIAINMDKHKFSYISEACNTFSTQFYQVLASSNEANVVGSPFGLHTILSLLSFGAGGSTADELKHVLSVNDMNELRNEFKHLISTFNDLKEIDFIISNAVYVQNDFTMLAEFISTGKEHFHSDILSVDFGNKINSVHHINSWVKEKTKNKIKSIITEGDIDEYTRVILVNAMYFKCLWHHQFKLGNTKLRTFHTSKTVVKQVPTMYIKTDFCYGDIPHLNARFIEIPYKNRDFDMVIILPLDIDGLTNVEQNFDMHMLFNLSGSIDETELYLPKFQFEIMLDLKDVLQKLNVNSMFEHTADFSKLSDKPLQVSKVFQKVFIDVSETGTEAAAATGIQIRLKRMISMCNEFVVDHPFMFIIRHKVTNIPLFIGSVRDLQAQEEKDEL